MTATKRQTTSQMTATSLNNDHMEGSFPYPGAIRKDAPGMTLPVSCDWSGGIQGRDFWWGGAMRAGLGFAVQPEKEQSAGNKKPVIEKEFLHHTFLWLWGRALRPRREPDGRKSHQ